MPLVTIIFNQLPPEVKLEKLFGNIEEVRQFSSTFLASLKATVGESPSPVSFHALISVLLKYSTNTFLPY